MVELKWIGVIGSVLVALIALVILIRERTWVKLKYREELKKAVLNPEFIASLRGVLEKDVEKHIAGALEPFSKEIKGLVQTIDTQSRTIIDETLARNTAMVKQATEAHLKHLDTVVNSQSALFTQEMTELTTALAVLQKDSQNFLTTYHTQVNTRIQELVDAHATDLLAGYLQSSLQGIELGDQQDFILAKLEENKAILKEELGNG